MKWKEEYFPVVLAYLLVGVYILYENNQVVTLLLLVCLFAYHSYIYSRVRDKLDDEKTVSVSKLKHLLQQSKKEQDETFRKFDSLSKSFGSGLLMINEDGVIAFANSDVRKYFNRGFSDSHYSELNDIERLYSFVDKAYLLEKSIREQIKVENRIYDLISTPLFENKLFQGTLILVHDITLIKNAESYQKRFTADVSHELRTPLAAIKGLSEILSRGNEIDPKERQEFIELIHKESERMEFILSDLLVISKLDRIDYELDFNKIEISEIIDECVSVLKRQINDKGLEIVTSIQKQELIIDKYRISQVIMNIIKNAINYTDEGFIRVEGKTECGNYAIKIIDSGIGIKEKNYDNIFKRFYRVDKARSRDSGGSGLGLSISKNVILKHGGTIKVSSEKDKGSTFIITIPIKE